MKSPLVTFLIQNLHFFVVETIRAIDGVDSSIRGQRYPVGAANNGSRVPLQLHKYRDFWRLLGRLHARGLPR